MNSTGLCHCGSQQKYAACCEPYLKQSKVPATAEALMRSRYSAFVEGDVDYIMATHDPSTRSQVSAADIGEWARNSEWKGLEILHVKDGGPEDRTAQMEFIARYKQKGVDVEHRERSDFRRRDDGRWYFVQGRVGAHETLQREAPKVGRNDPCPCGSGEKYKKCCAA